MMKRLALPALLVFATLAAGCGYLGSARPLDPRQFDREPGWVAVPDVQFQKQKTEYDCGAASVAMLLSHWGQPSTPEEIVAACPASKEGMKAGELRDLIKKRGLKGFLIHGTLEDLKTELSAKRPVIVGLIKPYVNGGFSHYEVVVGINPDLKRVATLDPAGGPRHNTYEGFLQEWEPAGTLTIVVIGPEGKAVPPKEPASSRLPLTLSPLMAAPDPALLSGSRRPPILSLKPEISVINSRHW
jgi:predicted double-glycine peptidase